MKERTMMLNQKNIELRNEKLLLLKKYEIYCYQIAFYLLENEVLALESTKQSLISLYQHPTFDTMPENNKRNTVKSIAMKSSLKLKKETYKTMHHL